MINHLILIVLFDDLLYIVQDVAKYTRLRTKYPLLHPFYVFFQSGILCNFLSSLKVPLLHHLAMFYRLYLLTPKSFSFTIYYQKTSKKSISFISIIIFILLNIAPALTSYSLISFHFCAFVPLEE